MARAIRNEYEPDLVSPPGETLQETLEAMGMTQAELSERTGRHRKTINEIIQGKAPITPEIAVQLERVLGVPTDFWSRREQQYRDFLARRDERRRLEEQTDFLTEIPVQAMANQGWIARHKDSVDQLREVLNFFGVASPQQWRELWSENLQVAFRKSRAFQGDPGAVAAWIRRAELLAQQLDCRPFDAPRFKTALREARSLTTTPPEVFVPKLQELCAHGGVACVFVPELPKTRASGATRWLTPGKALIALSLRYKSDDQLWFSFFHEAGHILLHPKKAIFIEEADGAEDEMERQADRFATSLLIPGADWKAFSRKPRFSKQAIRRFAHEQGIAPGIVVGRLQHEGRIPFSHCNDLKKRFEWVK